MVNLDEIGLQKNDQIVGYDCIENKFKIPFVNRVICSIGDPWVAKFEQMWRNCDEILNCVRQLRAGLRCRGRRDYVRPLLLKN